MFLSLKVILAKEVEEVDRTVAICLKRTVIRSEFILNDMEDILADSLSACLHSFYNGIENILEAIAVEVDGGMPKGDRWHKKLLMLMASEIPKVRPPVLSDESLQQLEEFRAFRHLFRNLYTHRLIPERVFNLSDKLEHAWIVVKKDLDEFLIFIGEVDGS